MELYDCEHRNVGISLYVPLSVFAVFECLAALIATVFSWQYRRKNMKVFHAKSSQIVDDVSDHERFWCKRSGYTSDHVMDGISPPIIPDSFQNGIFFVESDTSDTSSSDFYI